MLNILRNVNKINQVNMNYLNLLFLRKYDFSESKNLKKVSDSNNKYDKPKLKIKREEDQIISFLPQNDVPFFMLKESTRVKIKKGSPTISTGELKYSSYKLNDACGFIRGKYIKTAIAILESKHTKGAKIILKELKAYQERRQKEFENWKKFYYINKAKSEAELLEQKSNSNFNFEYGENSEDKSDQEQTQTKSSQNGQTNFTMIPRIESQSIDFKPKENSKDDNYIPHYDYLIKHAYVGRKRGQTLMTPRAKGRTFFVVRSISRLFIRIEKVEATKQFSEVAIGKADQSLALEIRKLLFTLNAPLKLLSQLSFITTSKGRYERRQQFPRLVRFLRDKYYKEKGVKINLEIISDQLKKYLGEQLSHLNPNNLAHIMTNVDKNKYEKEVYEKIQQSLFNNVQFDVREIDEDKLIDKSYEARKNLFEKKYKKLNE